MNRLFIFLFLALILSSACTSTHSDSTLEFCPDVTENAFFVETLENPSLLDDQGNGVSGVTLTIENTATVDESVASYATDISWSESGQNYVLTIGSCLTDDCFSLDGGTLNNIDVDVMPESYDVILDYDDADGETRELAFQMTVAQEAGIYDYAEYSCETSCDTEDNNFLPVDCPIFESSCTYSCTNNEEGSFSYEESGCGETLLEDVIPVADDECVLNEIILPTPPAVFEVEIES